MHAFEIPLALAARRERPAGESSRQIDKSTRPRVISDGGAYRAVVLVLHEAAGRFDRLLHLVGIVKIKRGVGQHVGPQRRDWAARAGRVDECELPCRMVQPSCNLCLRLVKTLLIVLITPSLFHLQQHDGKRNGGQSKQQKNAAKKNASSK